MVANCTIVNQVRQNIAQGLNNPLANVRNAPFSKNKGAYVGTNVVNFVPVPQSTYLNYGMMIPSAPHLAPIPGLNPSLSYVPLATVPNIPLGNINNNPVPPPTILNFPLNNAPSQNKRLPKNTNRSPNANNWLNWGKNTGNNLSNSASQPQAPVPTNPLIPVNNANQLGNQGLGTYTVGITIIVQGNNGFFGSTIIIFLGYLKD